MDGSRVIALARSLTTAGSRRQTLLAVAGSLGLLRLVHRQEATAKKKCPRCKKRKQGKCRGKKRDGTVCTGGTCQGGRCVELACGAGGPCRVFLSSLLYDGNLGGLAGADAKCQSLASAAGLPGSYKAWLSDTTSSPISRFVPSSGPYRLVNGTTIAATWADLTDGTLAAPIAVTETGGGSGASDFAWTFTKSDGTRANPTFDDHCANWSLSTGGSAGLGSVTRTTPQWSFSALSGCAGPHHLYCFQQR